MTDAPVDSRWPNDMGALEVYAANELGRKLAAMLDDSLSAYVSMIEGKPVNAAQEVPGTIGPAELMRNGFMMKLQYAPDDQWPNFFIWKRAEHGTVFAWRTSQDSHVNQNTHSLVFETKLQTMVLAKDKWPEGLRRFLEGGE